MALDAKLACNDHCPEAANCPVKALGQMKPVDSQYEGSIIQMMAARENVHRVLQQIKSDAQGQGCSHKSQIVSAVDGSCNGGHSHGHGCDSHNLGHHHETLEIAGRTEEFCDVDSLQQLADDIGRIVSDCDQSECADPNSTQRLRASLSQLRSYISELRSVSECTKKMCLFVAQAEDAKKTKISAADFTF